VTTEEIIELQYDKFTLRVRKDLWYAAYDTWVKVEGDEATIGITDFFQTKLGDIVYLNPNSGTAFEQDDVFATVESGKATADLAIPASGTVMAFNTALDDHPELINQEPYGKGWMVRVRLTDWQADQPMLLSPDAYYKLMQERVADALARKG
jgi:glycine cleavage system H protein